METLLSNFWFQWLWPILQFVVGFGLVIFVHEFGHFIVAKAVGVRVEQFALGFGTRLFGFKRGETDYRVNLLPMGGYVKLAGQEDFAPLKEEDRSDPRLFPNKSISARLAVISAGVTMNVILAALLFILVGVVGIRFPAPVVGGTLLGSPAANAVIHWQQKNEPPSVGLQPGDRILRVDGKRITRFNELTALSALADAGQKFTVLIDRRRGDKVEQGTTSLAVVEMGGTLHFGLVPAASTTFASLGDMIVDDPFKEGDRVVAINGRRIDYSWQIPEVEEHLDGKPVTLKIFRDGKEMDTVMQPRLRMEPGVFFQKDGARVAGKIIDYRQGGASVVLQLPGGKEKTLVLDQVIQPVPSEILDLAGLVPRLRVTGVYKDSPAYSSGLKPGDIVLEYGNRPSPTLKEFNQINDQVAETGTTIVVLRDNKRLPLEIRPTPHQGRTVVGIIAGVDLSTPVAAYVREASPAAKAGLRRGDVLSGASGRGIGNWIEFFEALKASNGQDVVVSWKKDGSWEKGASLGALTPLVFSPDDYHFVLFPGPRGFMPLMTEQVKRNPAAAVVWGFHETWDFIVMSYATLISYFRGTVSSKEFSGPVGIGSIAIQAGRQGIVYFIYFMAVISVSLAVLNFLPIPVVDGGHAVFLLIEKILGRPVPLRIQNAVATVGWVLMIALFLTLTWNDIQRILSKMW
jgi:regulator of sigma E protease